MASVNVHLHSTAIIGSLAVLSTDGKELKEKERLNKSTSCLEISCSRRIKILFRILKGALALMMFREDRCWLFPHCM